MTAVDIRGKRAVRAQVKQLYLQAFPRHERMPWCIFKWMSRRRRCRVTAYFDGETFCGFTHAYKAYGMLFLSYFAVEEGLRGRGYGSQILALLRAQNPDVDIVLNIEPLDADAPNLAQRQQRLAFYRRNGFYDTGALVTDVGGMYRALSTNPTLDEQGYKKMMRSLTCGLLRIIVKKDNKTE